MFCAGADLTGDAFAADYPDRLIELNRVIDAAPMPVIGAINGPAIGAGLQLAMMCDLRVVAGCVLQFPTSKYGLALDNWSIRRLSSLVGHGRARAMLLTAEKLTAEVALQTGMANRIGTLADAQAWAAEIAGLAPLAIQHAKRVLNDDGAYEEHSRRSTRSSSTEPGPARMSSRRRSRGSRSGHRRFSAGGGAGNPLQAQETIPALCCGMHRRDNWVISLRAHLHKGAAGPQMPFVGLCAFGSSASSRSSDQAPFSLNVRQILRKA